MKKKHIQLLIGIAVSAIFLYFAFKNVRWEDLKEAFSKTNWLYALPFVVVTMGSFYWRCFRWRIFLEPVKDIPSHRLFDSLMVGFAFNNIFPARAGEFARPFALMKQEKVPYAAGLSTIVVERIADAITLLLFFMLMPLYMPIDPTIQIEYGRYEIDADLLNNLVQKVSIAAVILLAGIFTFLVPAIRRVYISIVRALPLLPDGWKEKLVGLVESFAYGFECLKSPLSVFLVIVHSIVIWVSLAFTYQIMSWGFPGFNLSLGQGMAFVTITAVVVSLPSSPGFWGVFEFGGLFALLMMGSVADTEAGRSSALAYTILVHFLQWICLTSYGLWAAGKLHVSVAEAEEKAEEEAPDFMDEPLKEDSQPRA